MWAFLTALFQAVAAVFGYLTKSIIGLGTKIYNERFSDKAKLKKKAIQNLESAIKSGDRSEISAAFDRLNRIKIIVVAFLIFTYGCISKPIVLHPIEQTDIIRVKSGETITAPKDGYFLSDLYMSEVAQAKVESK